MNRSVASTGRCPSQPPRTTRARRDDAGIRAASGWSGRDSARGSVEGPLEPEARVPPGSFLQLAVDRVVRRLGAQLPAEGQRPAVRPVVAGHVLVEPGVA